MCNIYPKTTSTAVTRPNGTTAEQMFTALPEIIMGTTKMENDQTYTLNRTYADFRYLLFLYAPLSNLNCVHTMLFPVRFIKNGTLNQFSFSANISNTSTARAQIGFVDETTLGVQAVSGEGNYPDMYVRICGVK